MNQQQIRRFIFRLVLLGSVLQLHAQQTKLSVQTGHSGPINMLEFSPDNSIIATAGADNNVILWDLKSGKQITILSGQDGEIISLAFHPIQKLLATGSENGKLAVYQFPNGNEVYSDQFSSEVGAVSFSPDGNDLAVGTNELVLYQVRAYDKRALNSSSGSGTISSIAFSSDGTRIASGGKNRSVKVLDLNSGRELNQFRYKAHDLTFSDDGEALYGGAPNGNYFRVKLNGGKSIQIKANRFWKNYYSVTASENYLAAGNKDGLISVFDLQNRRIKYNLRAHEGSVNTVSLSNDGQLLASAGSDKRIVIWDLPHGKITREIYGTGNRINDVKFSEDGTNIYLVYADGAFRKCELTPDGKVIANQLLNKRWEELFNWPVIRSIDEISSVENQMVTMMASRKVESSDGSEYKKNNPLQVLWNTSENTFTLQETEGKLDKIFYSSVTSLKQDFNPTAQREHWTASINKANELVLEDTNAKTQRFIVKTGHTDVITAIDFSPVNDVLATSSWDGTVKLWDFDGNLLITYSSFGDNEFIFIDPQNHYFASKGALDKIGFLFDDRILSFEQFDLIYNRPDLVFDRLPHIQQEYVDSYRHAYFKRLEKLGISEKDLKITQDIPQMTFEADQSVVTGIKNLKLNITASDEQGYLDRLFVEVNGVPFFGKEGLKIPDQPQYWNTEIEIPLGAGVNDIQCFVMNKSGVSSLKEAFKITYNSNESKPDLYLVTIGASNYQQSEYDLTYAAKDAQDIATAFEEANIYKNVFTKTLVNQAFTHSSLGEIKAFLAPAGVDDVVMVSVAGHGILDQNLDYYLATYDMDFSDPSAKGVSYEALEDVLSDTKSRKKTLLMDACHSGELDKSEYELAYEENTEFGDISFRAVGATVVAKESSMSLKSSFELSKMLFADMRSSNGSVVISSAGGAEYAMEGGSWKNGVFTFCLLNGIETEEADLNGDHKIMLSELQEYIFSEVYRITGGKQQPTSRVENLKNDFRIW